MEAIQDDAFYYGYHKITHTLSREYNLIINHKKVYRLRRELQETDIKYGYIARENKFFFVLSIIDVFDRTIIDYYIGYSCTGSDAAGLLRCCLIKRDLFNSTTKSVIKTDNGPQFISHKFEDSCIDVNVIMKG